MDEFLTALRKLVDYDEPRVYEDESPGEVHMGNYDDCYEAGNRDGHRELAQSIRELMDKHFLESKNVDKVNK